MDRPLTLETLNVVATDSQYEYIWATRIYDRAAQGLENVLEVFSGNVLFLASNDNRKIQAVSDKMKDALAHFGVWIDCGYL